MLAAYALPRFDDTIPAHGTVLLNINNVPLTRSTIAYEDDGNGSLVQYAIDELRRDSAGLAHLEMVTTECAQHNNDISQAAWTKANASTAAAAFNTRLGAAAINLVANGAGDASISQTLMDAGGSGTRLNFAVDLRSDTGPHNVRVRLVAGAQTVDRTVSVGNTWQRVENCILKDYVATPTASVTILSPSNGNRVAIAAMGAQNNRGAAGSFVPRGSGAASRGADIAIGNTSLIVQHIRAGRPFGWLWRPGFYIDETATSGHDYIGDQVHISFGPLAGAPSGARLSEAVWGPRDGGIRTGEFWFRDGVNENPPAHKTIGPLGCDPDDIIEIWVYPSKGRSRIQGARAGNGIAQSAPWQFILDGVQIGNRLAAPGTHDLNGWISNIYAVNAF